MVLSRNSLLVIQIYQLSSPNSGIKIPCNPDDEVSRPKHENAPAMGALRHKELNDYLFRRGDSIKVLSNEVGL